MQDEYLRQYRGTELDADATLSLFGLTTTALLKLTLQSCKEKKKKVFHSSPIFAAWFLKNVDDDGGENRKLRLAPDEEDVFSVCRICSLPSLF